MSVPVTAKEKINKKNDVNARSLLLMALPNEHQLTFSQYNDAKTMFAAIKTQFGVWMNKAEIETMSIDDLYNNFKIVEQSVKKSVGANSGAQNLAFMTALSTSSTNGVNTTKPAYEVNIVSPNVNTASPQVSTASFSDNAVYAFIVKNPNGSNLLQHALEQIHEDDLEAMDLKWQLSLLSMRAKRILRFELETLLRIFFESTLSQVHTSKLQPRSSEVGQEHKMIKKVKSIDSSQGYNARLKISSIQSQKMKAQDQDH
ncbi:hypothetical protein Tco_1107432 [Tanacetum coccineum]